MKQVLIETMPFEFSKQQINESISKNNGMLIVKGKCQRANTKNRNGRIYPKNLLVREVNKYIKEQINQNSSIGELDHADSSIVSLKNASHKITKLEWVGDDLISEILILTTPAGNILKELFKCGVNVGISSRGLGTVEQMAEGTDRVLDDFEILCWDFVSHPSTHDANPKPIDGSMNENYLNEGELKVINEKETRINTIINNFLCKVAGQCSIK